MANPLMGSTQSNAVSGQRRRLNLNDVMGARGFDPNSTSAALQNYDAMKRQEAFNDANIAQQQASLALQQEAMDSAETANMVRTGISGAQTLGSAAYDIYGVTQGSPATTLAGKGYEALSGLWSGGATGAASSTGALGSAGASTPMAAGSPTVSGIMSGPSASPSLSGIGGAAPSAGSSLTSGMAAYGTGAGASAAAGSVGGVGAGAGGMAGSSTAGMSQAGVAGAAGSSGWVAGPVMAAAALIAASVFANNTESYSPGVSRWQYESNQGNLMVPGSVDRADALNSGPGGRWMKADQMTPEMRERAMTNLAMVSKISAGGGKEAWMDQYIRDNSPYGYTPTEAELARIEQIYNEQHYGQWGLGIGDPEASNYQGALTSPNVLMSDGSYQDMVVGREKSDWTAPEGVDPNVAWQDKYNQTPAYSYNQDTQSLVRNPDFNPEINLSDVMV